MWKQVDPIVRLLVILLLAFTVALFLAEWWFRSDAVFFMAIVSLVNNIIGALMIKIKIDVSQIHPTIAPPPGSITNTQVSQRIEVEPAPPTPPTPPPAGPEVQRGGFGATGSPTPETT